jgi:uncharacterized protein YndB with AHSA1/START domain
MSKNELRIERTFLAPRERVFDAWTSPETLGRWFGPPMTSVDVSEVDAKVGGRYRLAVRDPDKKSHEVSGVYRTVTRPSRLVFTWAWTQDDGSRGHEYTVEVAFADAPGGTRVTLVQRAFVDAGQLASHDHGWGGSFDKLEELLARAEAKA